MMAKSKPLQHLLKSYKHPQTAKNNIPSHAKTASKSVDPL